ncbi:MAG: calcineurin-like phosphoesterase C-terminal domain-containing protein [Bacteroidales bacterium]|nr:calcineurin-like phosphoesterase C-terminal domain-containing protein [Bacteroidales bacterium]
MKKLFALLAALAIAAASFSSCGGGSESGGGEEDTFNVDGLVVSAITAHSGDAITWSVLQSKGPQISDLIRLTSGTTDYDCKITAATGTSVTFTLNASIKSGTYTVYVVRGTKIVKKGTCKVTIQSKVEITPAAGTTVYGQVFCGDDAVKGVVVSDGVLFTTTDEDGIYELASEKANGYVFISVPSGYEPESNGFQAKFWNTLTAEATTAERSDFELTKVDNDNFKLLVLGDMHLANRNSDRKQFYNCTDDINDFAEENSTSKIYGLTLGDMTWDVFWYSNSYYFPQYIADMNAKIPSNIKFYHTIGNHDHDMNATGDWNTVTQYKKYLGPNNFSFNLGKYHFIVVDDIECTNKTASTSNGDYRSYNEKVVTDVINWVKKDLTYVDKTTPLIVASHAPLYYQTSATGSGANLTSLSTFLACFSGYTTHFMTGHTHKLYNIDKLSNTTTPHFEHNSGAVCAAWWWTGKLTNSSNPAAGLHIAQDGVPGGYFEYTITGTDIKWVFHATGRDNDEQFFTYDMNNVDLSSNTNASAYASYFSGYAKNTVLINVWDYDPSWTVEVKQDGVPCTVEQVYNYDPLYIMSYTANTNNTTFNPSPTYHLFRVVATNESNTLSIKVKDRFGNEYTEEMKRPKAFSTSAYCD